MTEYVIGAVIVSLVVVVPLALWGALTCYQKVEQGTALIRNGMGGIIVSFQGILVFPVIHRKELMDISVKRVEIDRMGENGLVCKDNMRADVKVAFFVRVNPQADDVKRVAQSLGCKRASDPKALVEFFDAKFSEALKTVGKQFEFEELYTNRLRFKEEILKVIGTDLNGYILDDAAIDYLEQTSMTVMDANNILDAEGIKKITDRTAKQAVLANEITRDKEKTIKRQDVEAREAILELERQQAEAEQKQQREIAEITARQVADARKVQEEERLKSERARIASDEEIAVAEENKARQVVVARMNKERTEKVETERVEKDRQLEVTERERVVTIAQIEKDKAVEVEKKNIQDVIRERVAVERTVVEQEEKINDTREFAAADRAKGVAVTQAQQEAEQAKVKETVAAESKKEAARFQADQVVIEAEAQRSASEKEADARKILADAKAQEEAVVGLGEARALEARAHATETFGTAEANVIERKAVAEAKGIEAKADAIEKEGKAEANVMGLKFHADAEGIREKAEAMKEFDGVGREHEEFKLQLNKEKEIELEALGVQRDIAGKQADVLGAALQTARIDIVGGESEFFDKIAGAIAGGKAVDRYLENSSALTDVKETFFNGEPEFFREQIKKFVGQFGLDTADIRDLTVSALMAKLFGMADDVDTKQSLQRIATEVQKAGLGKKKVSGLLG